MKKTKHIFEFFKYWIFQKIHIWALLFSAILVCTIYPNESDAEDETAEIEFNIKKELNKEKIEDFYQRILDIEALDSKRKKHIGKRREYRKNLDKEYEEARKNFVKERKTSPPLNSREWDEAERIRKIELEKSRKDYVRRRNELNSMDRTLGKIPEDEEYDLNIDYENQ